MRNAVARTVDRKARFDGLVSAAERMFAERGVIDTPVSEIVKAAGVAQGTFYLYFDSKDDVVVAVVDRLVETMVSSLKEAATRPATSAIDDFRALCAALGDLASLPGAAGLVEFMHTPQNRAIHDRLADQLSPRLAPIVQEVIERGIAQGVFSVPDPRAAAWFVMCALQSVELSGVAFADIPPALSAATELALRALGFAGTSM
jgi:AcrR family transcriptional regulator